MFVKGNHLLDSLDGSFQLMSCREPARTPPPSPEARFPPNFFGVLLVFTETNHQKGVPFTPLDTLLGLSLLRWSWTNR